MTTLVGQKAPFFKTKAVIQGRVYDNFSLEVYLGKHPVLLFFYPKDFTFVCPTELHAFQESLHAFEERSVKVVGCSTDSEYCHLAWLKMPKEQGGIQGVTYPLLADTNKTIAADYGVLAGRYYYDENKKLHATGELVAYRGLFLIDRQGIIQHQLVNNLSLGRSITETLRTIDALQHHETYGEVCPMNWTKGQEAIQTNLESVSAYLGKTHK
jgi:peroxiredoxin (alkyl hydroperoxide reductase subunit C)